MDDARLRGIAGKFHARRRGGEVEHALGMCEGRQRVVADRHPDAAEPGKLAGILADMRRAGPFDGAGHARARHGRHRADQRLSHAAARADHRQSHLRSSFAHAPLPAVFLGLPPATFTCPGAPSSTSPSPLASCMRWKRA